MERHFQCKCPSCGGPATTHMGPWFGVVPPPIYCSNCNPKMMFIEQTTVSAMTEERKAIIKYLREVSDMYAQSVEQDAEGGESRGDISDVLDTCVRDIEEMHYDTLPTD